MKKDKLTTKQFVCRVAIVTIFMALLALFIMCIFNMEWTCEILDNVWKTITPIIYGCALAYLTNFIYVKILKLEHKIVSRFKNADSFKEKHRTAIRNIGILISDPGNRPIEVFAISCKSISRFTLQRYTGS